jgi:hypothetical protein
VDLEDLAPEDRKLLALLGYDIAWLRHGVLTLDLLRAQAADFGQIDTDRAPEHYRNAALQTFLRAHESLTDVELHGLFEIECSEQSTVLRRNAIHSLLHRDILTDAQLDVVEANYQEPKLKELVLRRRLLRRLSRAPDPHTIEDCIERGDSKVQEFILGLADLAPMHLERLADRGANRSIRHRASMRLRKSQGRRPARGRDGS